MSVNRECVPLTSLLDSLLQKAYHDLTVLAELLPRKADVERKVEIVQFARQTRLLLVRLLALVKWTGDSNSVQECAEMSALLSQQSWMYSDTADQLAHLSRNLLPQACMPNFSLTPALDVLSLGQYLRLPLCIRSRTTPSPALAAQERLNTLCLMECAIRRRLLSEGVPSSMCVSSVCNGQVTLRVPYEFEISLSVVSTDWSVPWRLIAMKVLVSDALADKPVLIHSLQHQYLHQLVQSRLFGDSPLLGTYECLHSFCLGLQLDCLNMQAIRLNSHVCGGYVKVEEYVPGEKMRVSYWSPSGSSQFLTSFLLNQSKGSIWPKVTISIDPSSPSQPFTITHSPSLPPLPTPLAVSISPSELSVERLVVECVRVRAWALLGRLRAALNGSYWEHRAVLVECPLHLQVSVPLKYSACVLVIGVDGRVGNVVLGIEPSWGAGVGDRVRLQLEEMERIVTSNVDSLPDCLSKLQPQLFVSLLVGYASEQGLQTRSVLPLSSPLPLPLQPNLFIRLCRHAYLVVMATAEQGLEVQYYLLKEQLVLDEGGGMEEAASRAFSTCSLVELEEREVLHSHLRVVLVKHNGLLLKRKLCDSGMELPSTKKLCAAPRANFLLLPPLLTSKLYFEHLQTSLCNCSVLSEVSQTSNGTLFANVLSFPQLESQSLHKALETSLLSCRVFCTDSNGNFCCWMLLKGVLPAQQSECLVREVGIPCTCDPGHCLQLEWVSMCKLLGLALELLQYLQDPLWPCRSDCQVVQFDYGSLQLLCGVHVVTVLCDDGRLKLQLSEGCPHTLLLPSLEQLLLSSRSLPVLLQGMQVTEPTVKILQQFVKSTGSTVVDKSPSSIELTSHSFTVHINLISGNGVQFTELVYKRQGPTTVQKTATNYLQAFLHSVLLGEGNIEGSLEGAATPLYPPSSSSRPVLMPVPSPIASPRPSPWTSSPLPSIPSLPSPISETRTSPAHKGFSFIATLEQFRQLLVAEAGRPCSEMEAFLGSLSLLYFIIQQSQSSSLVASLQFVSCDRGVYMFQLETIYLSLALEVTPFPTLKVSLKPVLENVWAPNDLQTMEKFFSLMVVRCPFVTNALVAFVRLLSLKPMVLRSCAQLMEIHMEPPQEAVWRLEVCLTVPGGMEGVEAGMAAVTYKPKLFKLLLFIRLIHKSDGTSFVFPVVHDVKTNSTCVARCNLPPHLHQAVDLILKKNSGTDQFTGHHLQEPSLYPALRTLIHSDLPC